MSYYFTGPELTTNFNIIGACPDYQFVIFGGCPEATQGKPLVWIDFRNPNPSERDVKAATKIIEENGMNITDFGNGCKNKAEYILN
ncbi:hypothetical protein C0J52_10021 [Blattella germanica]|nr:hypothetical protein C0J52_10021 [Blattella germanica]